MADETEKDMNAEDVGPGAESAEATSETAVEPETTRADSSSEATPASPAESAPPAEVVPPKERRARARAAKASKRPRGKSQTPEERHAARVEERSQKASARTRQRAKARAKAKAASSHAEPTEAREHPPAVQKVRQGVVVSDKADKTITVRIDTARRHRRYQKIVRTSSTLHAHDETNDAHEGDTVIVREARPLSRTKRWRLVEVVERAK